MQSGNDNPMLTLQELLRLILNLIRIGTIKSVDVDAALCIVETGDNETGPIKWVSLRAGTTKHWSPPTEGEQVILLSPGGDLGQAIAIVGLFSDQNPAPSSSGDIIGTFLPDGSEVLYNHTDNQLAINLKGASNITLDQAANITVKDGDCTLDVQKGNAVVNGQLVKLNNGAGVVTGANICAYTGAPHPDCSQVVFAGNLPAGGE